MGIVVSKSSAVGDATLSPTTLPSQVGNADTGLGCIEATCLGNTAHPCYLADSQIEDAMVAANNAASYIPMNVGAGFWTILSQVGSYQWRLMFPRCRYTGGSGC